MLCKHQVIGSIPIGSTNFCRSQCEALASTKFAHLAKNTPEMKITGFVGMPTDEGHLAPSLTL